MVDFSEFYNEGITNSSQEEAVTDRGNNRSSEGAEEQTDVRIHGIRDYLRANIAACVLCCIGLGIYLLGAIFFF